jgi:hypothetical protein
MEITIFRVNKFDSFYLEIFSLLDFFEQKSATQKNYNPCITIYSHDSLIGFILNFLFIFIKK